MLWHCCRVVLVHLWHCYYTVIALPLRSCCHAAFALFSRSYSIVVALLLRCSRVVVALLLLLLWRCFSCVVALLVLCCRVVLLSLLSRLCCYFCFVVVIVADMPLKLEETNISNEQVLKIPTGGRQTSWLFTSMTEELNWGPPRNNSSLVVRAGLEPATSGIQVRRPNHSAMLPPCSA